MRPDLPRLPRPEERDIMSLWHGNDLTVDLIAARLRRSPQEVRATMASLVRCHNPDHEARLRSRPFPRVLAEDFT